MALLVTGGMGHVGQEVVRHALAAGAAVIAQYRTTYRDFDIRALSGNVRWVSCDLADPTAVAALCEAHPIDACIHSAAVSNEKYARPQPLTAINANVGAIANLLDMARQKNWRRFLFVSTGSVFQNATDTSKPIAEDATPAVTNIYSTTKFCGELLTTMYRSQFDLSAATVRISWVYGPPLVTDDPPRGPMPWFLKCALSGKPIRRASGGDFAASFTHVADVAAGLIAACEPRRCITRSITSAPARISRPARSPTPCAGPCRARHRGRTGHGALDRPYPHARSAGGQPPVRGYRLQADTRLEHGVRSFADWMRANRTCAMSAPPARSTSASPIVVARPRAGRRLPAGHPGRGAHDRDAELPSVANLTNVALQIAVLVIVALGMTLVILTEGIDLSLGPFSGCAASWARWWCRAAIAVLAVGAAL